jgi:hypothetical protein
MSSLYRHPVSFRGRDYKVLSTGVYMDGKVYCHLSQVDNPPRQVAVFIPIEVVFSFEDAGLVKKIAAYKSRYTDEVCIAWNPLNQEGYSQDEVLATIRQGIEAGIFRHESGGLWTGQTLHLNTRPTSGEAVA